MDTLMIALMVLAAILWIWAVYDLSKSGIRNKTNLGWLLLVLFFPIIGPIVYFQLKRRIYNR